ncbi:hypothetical protein GGTG_13563 [Gaeumannomyces tritici R3-111a-1]|uniref:PNPLA domain-containing protein n=1 Tax=Gaeumannomyces tritici (strain R3-111a-1) TaxID=644352 RepID=J3PJ82_GAET3|nr:hypothetical protein GGTG_13563 [Gaeumannomyces tritici R3-111a-1]EJT68900.1 hypothetical protein GGTG_13563 [Gaeumannomyces tritici R3-111a-1]
MGLVGHVHWARAYLRQMTIWQACRATSAATTFFDPIAIGPFGEEFVDGALGANNPVYVVWNQAQDVWGDQLQRKLRCFVSIGTGVPNLKPVRDDALGIWSTLKELATETEKTAQQFHRDKSALDDEGRYYRFNVDHGLEEIGLEESKKKAEIAAATRRYIESQAVFKQMKACANDLALHEYFGPYRTPFSLQGMPISDNFVDRPSDAAVLERHLLPQPHLPQTRQRVFVLHGLGGIGKTQLAADFARRHKATFSSVFWLDGRSEDRVRQSFASCAKRIPQGQIPDRSRNMVPSSEDDLNVVIADVMEWLAQPDNVDWLLVFDNVDQDHEQGGATGAYDIRKYLPADHGSVLITTRLLRLEQLGDAEKLKKVDEKLSKAIFQRWCRAELVMDEVGIALLGLLDGLPLALAQAGAYIRETELDMASYVRLYRDQWDDMIESEKTGTPLADYEQRSVGTTWTISFKAVEARSKSAANLVRLWAFLDNRDLWHSLLQKTVDGQWWPAWLCEIACNEIKFMDAIRLLLRYSMIEAQESVCRSYMVHPVVHRWTAHMQDGPGKRDFVRLAMMVVGSIVPSSTEKDYWILQRRLFPHAERCVWWTRNIGKGGKAKETLEERQVAYAMSRLGSLYSDQSRLIEAEALYERALQGFEKAFGLDHRLTLNIVDNLAAVYFDQGRPTEAESLFGRALQGKEKALGPDDQSTLDTVNNLARLYSDQNRLAEAETLFERVLQGREKAFGPDHTLTLEALNNMANLCKARGRLAKAESLYKRALQGKEKALGPDHPSTLDTANNLAALYCDQGRPTEAESLFERALQGKEKALGPDDPSTLDTVNNLASLYSDQGRLAEAETLYERALQGYEKALGPDHPKSQIVLRNMQLLKQP